MTATPSTPQGWAIALFERSVLKQAKLAQIVALLGPTGGCVLNLGGDNGVVSALLGLVGAPGGRRPRRSGRWPPFRPTSRIERRPDRWRRVASIAQFGVVAIVDLLEHLHDDGRFVGELARVKPGGRLVVNVPHIKRRSC
ncbi:MAG: hypothetical protein U0Q12_02275 [Vicinamibacterales bacterium]